MTLVITIALPYALAAMCGALTERSGLIDLALEAKLLFGAFAAAVLVFGGLLYLGVLALVRDRTLVELLARFRRQGAPAAAEAATPPAR